MSGIERDLPLTNDGSKLTFGAVVPDDPRGVVLLLHGIPSIAPPEEGDLGYPGFARAVADEGWLAVWGDMRAVRGSEGFFSMEGWVRDATEFVRAARAIDEGRSLPFAFVGSSAGGAVATEVVARGTAVDALALLAAPAAWISFAGDPASALQMMQLQAGMALSPEAIEDPAAWAAEFDNVTVERSIGGVEVPTLIMHGDADEVVPVSHAYRLHEAQPSARLEIVPGAPHQLRRHAGATRILLDWLGEVLK
jgi:pimeloyl-ACP methyl ester carboxylesterase